MAKTNNPHLGRERAVYDYLESLENGDIDGIIESLQLAIYDAPLDQMLVDAHQSYFQEEQKQQTELVELDTQAMPALQPITFRPRPMGQKRASGVRRVSRWVQTLAAVLIVGALLGSFAAIQAFRHTPASPAGQPTPLVCQPYPWQITGTETQGGLSGVVALSPTDAWAIGGHLTEHWDGRKWNTVQTPPLASGLGSLQAIAAVSSDNLWAVGVQERMPAGGSGSNGSSSKPAIGSTLIEHWDGHQWTIVPSPNARQGEGTQNSLSSIAVVSASNIWAVGAWRDLVKNTQGTLVVHWDGQVWSRVADQGSQVRASVLWTSTVIAGNQVLASGAQIGNDGRYHAFLERWDGRNWNRVDTTSLGQHAATILSLSVASEHDIWAIVQENIPISGQQVSSTGNYVEHWDGQQQWTKASTPAWLVNPGQSNVTQVLAVSPMDVWVIGRWITDGRLQPLIAHWTGKTWEQIHQPLTDKSLGSDAQVTDLAVSAGAIWVVGYTLGDESSPSTHNLIVQQSTCHQ